MNINTSPIKYLLPEQQRGGVSLSYINTYDVGTMRCDIKFLHYINKQYKLHIFDMHSKPKYDLFTRFYNTIPG